MREKIIGRPPKDIEEKLCRSINLKLKIDDYCNLLDKTDKLKMSLTAYARTLILKGEVKRPYTDEELHLMRQLAGEANNLNQIAKHLNSGATSYQIVACAVINKIKKMIDDSKKY